MFKPEVAPPESKQKPEKSFDELQNEHTTLATQAQLLDQQLKAIRAEILNKAHQTNQAHPLLNKADEVWFNIFSHLPLRSRTLAQRSCVRFFQLGTDPRLPAFPLDYTAIPQYTDLSTFQSTPHRQLFFFNLPSAKQFAIADRTDIEHHQNARSTNLIYLINSYTGTEEALFRIALPFDTIRLIGTIEKNKLLFVGEHAFRNTIEIVSYNLQSKKQEMIYQLSGQLSNNRTVIQLTTGQIVFSYLKSKAWDERDQLHIVTLKTPSEPCTAIDVPLDAHYQYFDEIKSGKFMNQLILYSNHEFMILNLKGEIQKMITLEKDKLPHHFTIYEEQVQEPKANELIFNSGQYLLHLNLINGAYTIVDFRFFDRWVMTKFIDQENIILNNVNEEAPKNKLILWNTRTQIRKEVAVFESNEKPTRFFTLANGNLMVQIENSVSNKMRYALYRFPEQQLIAQSTVSSTNAGTVCPTQEAGHAINNRKLSIVP